MDKFMDLLNVQVGMIIYIIIGVICRKLRIIDDRAQKCLITLALNVVLPCKIFASIVRDMNEIVLGDSLFTAALSIVVVLCCYFIGKLIFRKAPPDRRPSLEVGCMCTNAAFVGIPIAESAFGAVGVYYTTIFMLVCIPLLWTLGLSRFTRDEKRSAWRMLLLSPTTITIALAIICVAVGFKIPPILDPVFNELSASSTMMCMLPIGYMVAEMRPRDLKEPSVWLFSFVRLIALPLAALLLLRLFRVDRTIANVTVLLTSAPAPILTAMFAARHGKDSVYATVLLLLTTLLALITVPLLTLLYL